jgi:hypothetical protein
MVTAGVLPPDPDGIDLVLTTADVDVHYNGFLGIGVQRLCVDFCGYHATRRASVRISNTPSLATPTDVRRLARLAVRTGTGS